VLQEQHARCGEFSTLEDLFEQTVSDYQKRINALTSLTEDAWQQTISQRLTS
jgi:ferritin-like protein 2